VRHPRRKRPDGGGGGVGDSGAGVGQAMGPSFFVGSAASSADPGKTLSSRPEHHPSRRIRSGRSRDASAAHSSTDRTPTAPRAVDLPGQVGLKGRPVCVLIDRTRRERPLPQNW
jgi:hypothetical protein